MVSNEGDKGVKRTIGLSLIKTGTEEDREEGSPFALTKEVIKTKIFCLRFVSLPGPLFKTKRKDGFNGYNPFPPSFDIIDVLSSFFFSFLSTTLSM